MLPFWLVEGKAKREFFLDLPSSKFIYLMLQGKEKIANSSLFACYFPHCFMCDLCFVYSTQGQLHSKPWHNKNCLMDLEEQNMDWEQEVEYYCAQLTLSGKWIVSEF